MESYRESYGLLFYTPLYALSKMPYGHSNYLWKPVLHTTSIMASISSSSLLFLFFPAPILCEVNEHLVRPKKLYTPPVNPPPEKVWANCFEVITSKCVCTQDTNIEVFPEIKGSQTISHYSVWDYALSNSPWVHGASVPKSHLVHCLSNQNLD